IYPEMDYEAWGSFWKAAQVQVANQVKVLQKHVYEVQMCQSAHKLESYVKYLVDSIDVTFKSLGAVYRSCALSSEDFDRIIDVAMTAHAKTIFALSPEDTDELIAYWADSVTNDAPDLSRKRSHRRMSAENTPNSAEGIFQPSRADATIRSEKPQSEPTLVERMSERLEEILAAESAKSQSDSELFERMRGWLARLQAEEHSMHLQRQPGIEE
ncbi:hypothetical protein PAPHI01_2084, partial [Pancytospora philotis]